MTKFARWTTIAAAYVLMAASLGQAQNNQPADNQPAGDQKPAVPALPIMRLDADGPVSEIRALAFSGDGQTLYAAGLDKMVYAWTRNADGQFQFAPDRLLRIPIGPDISGTINAMAISSDGRYLAVGGQMVGRRFTGFREGGLIFPASTKSEQDLLDTGTIFVFDLQDPAQPKLIHLRGHLGTVIMLAFARSEPGRSPVLASGAEEFDKTTGEQRGAVRVWDLSNPQKSIAEKFDLAAPSVLKDNLPRAIAAIRTGIKPTDLQVGIAWGDNKLRVWDIANQRTSLLDNSTTIACDGVGTNLFLVGGFDSKAGGDLGLWQPPVKKVVARMGRNAPIGLAKAAGPNVNTVLVISLKMPSRQGEPRKVEFFLADAAKVSRLPGNASNVEFGGELRGNLMRPAYAISPNADLVAVAGNVDRKIQVYSVRPNQAPAKIQELQGIGDIYPRVRFYRNAQSLGLGLNKAANNQNNAADLIFDLTQGEAVANQAGWNPAPANAGISAALGQQGDRTTVALNLGGGQTRTIVLPQDQTVDRTLPAQFALCPRTGNHPPLLGLIVKSPLFAESILRVYNAETGDRLRQFSGHTDVITSIAFSDDGKLLASAGMDRTVRVWWMEDLKDHIGQHGFLDNLQLYDKNDKPTVKEIDEFAAADVKAALRVGDVIEGFTRPDQTFQATKKSSSFFYYLSTVPPISEADGRPAAVKLQVRRGDNLLPNPPEVRVQQGVDERKPLFTLFFREGQAGRRSWIGWTPLGPFDSSDPDIEKLVGWHFNPSNPEAPASYATLAEYNTDHHQKGLFKPLIETGKLPEEKPIGPPPPGPPAPPAKVIRTSLFIHEIPKEPEPQVARQLELNDKQQVWAQNNKLTALFRVTGIEPSQIKDSLTWHVDGVKQNLPVVEIGGGRFEADLSSYPWKAKPEDKSYTLRVGFVEEAAEQEFFVEQAIVFAPPPPPPPPTPKKLPLPSIVSPDLLTVLYESLNPREIAMAVELAQADADPVQPGQLTFEINDKPVERNGQALVRPFDEKLARIDETLPLVDGVNSIRVRLKSAEGEAERLSKPVVVYYRRPPQVQSVKAQADVENPYAQITSEVKTPADLPLVDFQIYVNDALFSVGDEQITKTQDETDKTVWTVTAKDVPLSEGQNSILFYPRNADSRALATMKVEVPWQRQKPPVPVQPKPSRPKIYFSNADNQIPIAGRWQGDDFNVAFNVVSSAKLKQVLVYYNGKRLDSPAIPEAKEGTKYEFQVPVKLALDQNQLRVVVRDENTWNQAPITLAPLKPPFTLVIDEMLIPGQDNLSLKPQTCEYGEVKFDRDIPGGRVVLRGRIVASDTSFSLERPFVKCWVNGFLQWGRAIPVPKNPREWRFAMNLTLNRAKENFVRLELPDVAEDQRSQTLCKVNCQQPETKQKLRVIALGVDPANRRSVDTDSLVTEIKKAFNVQNGRNGVFDEVHFYPLKGTVRAAQIADLLDRIHSQSKPEAEQGEHDVIVFYYQGAEVLNPQEQVLLQTQDDVRDEDVLTKSRLQSLLNEMYGAHVAFLDVAPAKKAGKDWQTGQFLGVVRRIHNGPRPANNFPLAAALQKALPNARELKDLPQEVRQVLGDEVNDSVPEDLKHLIVH